ncbi:MAG: TrmB family transcriptional regulator [Haloarculaceae archaeon]
MGQTHDDADLREELRTFGFSDTEIDAYLAILSHGETTTREVSEDADVTQRAVYDIAERLEDRGVVRVNDHASPTTIRALPPDEAIENLSERLESIRPTLEDRFDEVEKRAPEIQVIKSRETALKRLRNAIPEAEHEVALAIPEDIYAEVVPELRDAKERDALVFLLVADLDDPEDDGHDFAGTADVVRYWGESVPPMYAVDDDTAMIGDVGVFAGTHVDENAVFVDEENLGGSIFGVFMGAYWQASNELFVTDPDPLPKTYEWFRDAALHAHLHDQRGTAVRAEVETKEDGHIAGPICQVRQSFVEPSTGEFTLETSFYIETDEGEVSVGGRGSFIEDYVATSVTLLPDS